MIYNWNIVGHESTLSLLENNIQSDNVAQCYLFVGPNQLGKFTVAQKMAGILQCENNFCHECRVCVQMQKGIHPDNISVPNDGESLKIDQIREIINRVNMTSQGRHTTVLIESIERLTPEASNSLLKTLEEPPEGVIFFLTTENTKSILPTIISRSRILNFKLCGENTLMGYLKKRFPESDEDALSKACLLSLGKPGKAIALLEDGSLMGYYQTLYDDATSMLAEKSVTRKFSYVESILETPFMAQDFLDVMEHVTRTRMLASPFLSDNLISLIEEIQFTREYLTKNINSKLALENLLLAI